jgi:hypothetical protein
MPMLDKESQRQLLGVTDRQCPKCLQWIRKNYCRSCDEFFFECDCTRHDGPTPHKHLWHRTY